MWNLRLVRTEITGEILQRCADNITCVSLSKEQHFCIFLDDLVQSVVLHTPVVFNRLHYLYIRETCLKTPIITTAYVHQVLTVEAT